MEIAMNFYLESRIHPNSPPQTPTNSTTTHLKLTIAHDTMKKTEKSSHFFYCFSRHQDIARLTSNIFNGVEQLTSWRSTCRE
jgi:hypothetical protein